MRNAFTNDGATPVPEVTDERRARARLDEVLTSRQVVFVTGKGGVGKSVVSAALAIRAKELGLRPVLFECDAPTRQSLLPGGRLMTEEITEVAPGILGINQRSDDAIRDYAASTLPSKTVSDLLFENRVARLFLKASPSVTEMAVIGRIIAVSEKYGADGPVIVDLHATGHAVSLLRAPAGIMKVLQRGALFDRAQKIEAMLQDASRTAFVTVAVPEELPVTELLELHDKLTELGAPIGPVILNSWSKSPGDIDAATLEALLASPGTRSAARDLRFLIIQASRSQRERDRLLAALKAKHKDDVSLVTLATRFDDDGGLMARRLADDLGKKIL
jgi:anion-transporting  ArsA/GET3 family ATPase